MLYLHLLLGTDRARLLYAWPFFNIYTAFGVVFVFDYRSHVCRTLQLSDHSFSSQVGGHDVETAAEAGGYYRLAFGGEETTCIGYHATEDTVQASGRGVLGLPEYHASEAFGVAYARESGFCCYGL